MCSFPKTRSVHRSVGRSVCWYAVGFSQFPKREGSYSSMSNGSSFFPLLSHPTKFTFALTLTQKCQTLLLHLKTANRKTCLQPLIIHHINNRVSTNMRNSKRTQNGSRNSRLCGYNPLIFPYMYIYMWI